MHLRSCTLIILALLGLAVTHAVSVQFSEPCQPGTWRQIPNRAFGEREVLIYDVRWGILKAGKAVMAVEAVEVLRERPAYHLSMEIKTKGTAQALHPYRDRTDSWLDRESFNTLRYQKVVRQKRYELDEMADLDPACGRFRVEEKRLDKNRIQVHQGRMPPNTVDLYGALYYLRTQALAVDQGHELSLLVGEKVYPVTALIRKKERVKTGVGKFECFLIELATPDQEAQRKIKEVQWWVTTDERHLPVRIRMEVGVGHISAILAQQE